MPLFLNLASCPFQIFDPHRICASLFEDWSIYLSSQPLQIPAWSVYIESLESPCPTLVQDQRPRWTQHYSTLQKTKESKPVSYTYETHRLDFSLYLNELSSPPQAYIQTDGSQGSLEACFQILLQIHLRSQGGALIHASGVIDQNQGWLLPGLSGAGKSTAARLGGFQQVLSDEFIAITPTLSELIPSNDPPLATHASFLMWATPFWSNWDSHLFPLYHGSISLDLIAFPQHGPLTGPPQLRPINSLDTTIKLIQALVSYEYSLSSQEYLLNWATHVSATIPSYLLSFPKKENWRQLLANDPC